MEKGTRELAQKTILLVDDDPAVVTLVSEMLDQGKYNILTAPGGQEGLRESREFKGEIQVLVSDFQMAEMSGIELATAMTKDRPELKVLLMSGFTGGILVLNEGWHFLPKPFVGSQLRSLVEGLINPHKKSRYSESANDNEPASFLADPC